jgi:acetyltransferase
MQNLLAGGFNGPILPVNPHRESVAGVLAAPDVDSLPLAPDLAVICIPPPAIAGVVGRLAERGTRAAIILTAGFGSDPNAGTGEPVSAILSAARPALMRVLGPNCLGLLVPGIGLNASFAHVGASPGSIAFVSQSGALCTAVLDVARSSGIGFSHFVSVGDSADVDFGDLLDYLASDPSVRSILLYAEDIRHARKFMSAARAASRNKPVIVVKAGRSDAGARAALSHTGALAGSDVVYEAAFRRAGMLRVRTLDELFEAVETLAHVRARTRDRLIVVSNGGGPGVLAADALIASGGRLAEVSDSCRVRLDSILPSTWSGANPIDIIGDADSDRYAGALRALEGEGEGDSVLVLHAPTATVSATAAADAVIATTRGWNRHVMTCWLGHDGVVEARRRFSAAGLATYSTPESAIRAFMHLFEFRRNQEALIETPTSMPKGLVPNVARARAMISDALSRGCSVLGEIDAKTILDCYGIPTVETRHVATPEDVAACADEIGYPVAIKVLSPDIVHKSDIGGVALDVLNAETALLAASGMEARLRAAIPGARFAGFAVERMVRVPGARELIVGAAVDGTFGPVIVFGEGGTAVETVSDRAVGLPPLNLALADDLIRRTRVARLLEGYRSVPAVDLEAIRLSLVRVSQMVIDLPEILELDINPLIAGTRGAIALDARLRIGPATASGEARLAVRPYPSELEERTVLADGRDVVLRPIRPEDEPAHQAFFAHLSPEDIRFRFFGLVSSLPHSEMARYTQIDYDREMAFIATSPAADGAPETLGVVRIATDPDNERAEFAIVIRSDLKGRGLGRKLMEKIIRYCRSRGTGMIVGQVLRDNATMLGLAESLGFRRCSRVGDDAIEVELCLHGGPDGVNAEDRAPVG